MKIMKNYKVEATYDENFLLTAVVACEKIGLIGMVTGIYADQTTQIAACRGMWQSIG